MRRRSFLSASLGFSAAAALRSAPVPHRGFDNIGAKAGVNFVHAASKTSQKYLPESMGAGVAMFDYNNDGLLDLFFVNGAALADPMADGQQPDKSDPRFWNRLYRNNGNGTFTDVTKESGLRGEGYGMGVAVGDFDNDGFPDLFVTNFGGNQLYRNNGDGTFTDVTRKAGVAGGGWSAGACFVDFDRDGHLDLVVARYLDWDWSRNIHCGERKPGYRAYCHPNEYGPIAHFLYRNNGDGVFTDVSGPSRVAAAPGKGLGIAIHDLDGDGWPDIVIANDSFPQQLFRNRKDGTFMETAVESGLAYDEDGKTFAGMGIGFADYDNDGRPDVFINALANQRYALFQNQNDGLVYVSGPSGVAGITQKHSGWGAAFLDYDNDGFKDLFVAQGHVLDNIALTQPGTHYLEPPLLMRNRKGKFEDVSRASGAVFQIPIAARGAAFGDLNNDGNIDIAINCNNGPAVVLMNRGTPGSHWLSIDTAGTKSNRDGIGARIKVVSKTVGEQFGFVSTAGSYLSASDKRLHFGLGPDTTVMSIEVTWPSGIVQRLDGIKADRTLKLREPTR